jgi:shikimate dehydrogenase
MKWGHSEGAALCADGLGMLVEQAAEAFFLWRSIRPETGDVLMTLRKHA